MISMMNYNSDFQNIKNKILLIFILVHLSSYFQPAAKISWLINGEMINPKFVKTIPGPKQMNGLQSTRSEISFYSERSHYRNGLLKIHCIAKIDQQYDVHTDKILIGEPTKSANGHQTNVGKGKYSSKQIIIYENFNIFLIYKTIYSSVIIS